MRILCTYRCIVCEELFPFPGPIEPCDTKGPELLGRCHECMDRLGYVR